MRKPRLTARSGVIAALDIGSSKICCLIGKIEDSGRPSVIGIGHQLSRGVKNGAIVDMDEAEMAILTAVHAAEKMSAGYRQGATSQAIATPLQAKAYAVARMPRLPSMV